MEAAPAIEERGMRLAELAEWVIRLQDAAHETDIEVAPIPDPSGQTDIRLEIGKQYGRGPTAYALLLFPDGTKKPVVARGYDRLLAKVWRKLRAWAAESGIRDGDASLGPIFYGRHRGAVGVLTGLNERNAYLRGVLQVYGRAAGQRVISDRRDGLLPDFEKTLAWVEAEQVLLQAQIDDAEQVLQECATEWTEARKASVRETIASVKRYKALQQKALAKDHAVLADLGVS
jgi:hypothetical protein